MEFRKLAEYYDRLEATTKRLEMREILVQLLGEATPDEAQRIAMLSLGKLYPPYVGIELGMAEKLAIRALRSVTGASEAEVEKLLAKKGDLGLVAEELLSKRKAQTILFQEPLTVDQVYTTFERIARETGEGAMENKVKLLTGLLAKAEPKEAKYIVRLVTGTMRLGVADMTFIDAASAVLGDISSFREDIERAYNITSDIGLVVKLVKVGGVEAVRGVRLRIGMPVRPMLAERLTSAKDILDKLGGKGLAEYKYDGERLQIHKDGSRIMIFSRRQENITHQFPDVVKKCGQRLSADQAIVECEAVAMDPDTGSMLPFQELMHRRRKYEVEKAVELYPVGLFFFDAIYVDGEDLMNRPLPERRSWLKEVVVSDETFGLTVAKLVEDPSDLDSFMQRAVEDGCEGVIVKDVSPKSVYRAGARGWLWIKYKRSYVSKLTDTVDLVVIGAFHGKGKRSGWYGTLLMSAYDPRSDTFKSVCKVGTGFKEEDLKRLKAMIEERVVRERPARVDSLMQPDVWVRPDIVLEIVGDEITVSPIHTCGWGTIQPNAGLAIRFPRFTGRYRSDKGPEDATTVDEIVEMYRSQLKSIVPEEGEAL
ncbi:MAG: ATP-dependent DNA ligase [Thaumarchaeota archaeon]|nr:ATP-dependent DNA ligase [Candidatus Calditenuaceae archaeon]MDW8186561.1 ATP-dependent DNA ligase [Nitrososphaerota archaeon]